MKYDLGKHCINKTLLLCTIIINIIFITITLFSYLFQGAFHVLEPFMFLHLTILWFY